MKRLMAFILLSAFTFNVMGSFLILIVQKYQAKKEMLKLIKNGLSENEITDIKVTSENINNIHWKDAKEFFFNGVLYDVVTVDKVNERTTIYHCINDKKEEQLLSKLIKKTNKNNPSKDSQSNTLKLLVKVLFSIKPRIKFNNIAISLKNKSGTFEYKKLYKSLSLDVLSPPPRFFS